MIIFSLNLGQLRQNINHIADNLIFQKILTKIYFKTNPALGMHNLLYI
jgi:hypothetical protein